MLISDWSSDVCSSDLVGIHAQRAALAAPIVETLRPDIADAQFAAEGRFDKIARVIEAEIAAAIEPFLIDEFEDRMIERLGVDEGAEVELYRAPVETRAVLDANRIDIAAMVARDRSRGGKPRRGQIGRAHV